MWQKLPNLLNILQSKASISQMLQGRVHLAIVAISPLERALGATGIIPFITKVSKLDSKLLFNIYRGKYNYFDLLQQEIKYICANQHHQDQSFHLPQNFTDIKPGQLNLVICVEGGHALEGGDTDLKTNLLTLKKSQPPVFYLTLVHLARCHLANHAYSIKLIGNHQFKPHGIGLSQPGKEIIDLAYDQKKGRRILIDIKHLSLVARMEFYRYRRQKQFTRIPLIASHVAVAGISWMNLLESIEQDPQIKDELIKVTYHKPLGIGNHQFQTCFNPSTINIYDEEIELILESEGMIGLIMDQRILGFGKMEEDYFSREEFSYLIDYLSAPEMEDRIGRKSRKFVSVRFQNGAGAIMEKLTVGRKNLHLKYLVNNIFHILLQGGEKAWNHICLGSDYDGFINPINNCREINHYPRLYQDLVTIMPPLYEMMQATKGELPFHLDQLQEKVEKIMYGNIMNFLQKHF